MGPSEDWAGPPGAAARNLDSGVPGRFGVAVLETTPMLLILLAILLLFGATAIPKLARSLGRAKGEFSKAKGEFDAEAKRAAGTPVPAMSPAASEEQVRQAARNLGIQEADMPLDEVKRQLNQRLN